VVLTEREQEVLALVARGCTNAQAAAVLHLSPRTVANHLYRIFHRLGVHNRAGATRWWLIGAEGEMRRPA
jgi:DNA-binding CsgD family transcriptional regulator